LLATADKLAWECEIIRKLPGARELIQMRASRITEHSAVKEKT